MEKYEQINLIGELQDSLTEEEQLRLEADSILKQIIESPLLDYKADFMEHSFMEYVNYSLTLPSSNELFTEHERETLAKLEEKERFYENELKAYQHSFVDNLLEEGEEEDIDSMELVDKLLETDKYQELTSKLTNLSVLVCGISAVGWVRYIDSLKDNYDQAIEDIKQIYNCSLGKSRAYKSHQYKTLLFTLDREDIHAETDIPLFGTDREAILSSYDNLYSNWIPNYAIFQLIAISYYDYDDTEALSLVDNAIADIRVLLETANLSSIPIEPTEIQSIPPTAIEYPLDPLNNNLWGNHNIKFGVATGIPTTARADVSKEIHKQLNFLLEANKNVSIDTPLTDYEKRVMISADNLFTAGNPVITASAIYKNMTGKRSPSHAQVQEINEAITRLSNINVTIDLTDDYDSYTSKDTDGTVKQYDGKLIPMERISAFIDGTLTDSAIHLFREPPLMEFARDRGQITTLRLEDYQLKNLSQQHLKIRDYLIRRIAPMKNAEAHKGGKKSNRRPLSRTIKLDTLYKATGCDTSMKRKRGLEKTEEHLKELKHTGYIKGYSFTKDGNGINIIL